MPPENSEQSILDTELDNICEGFREAIDLEVATLRREGLPIYVSDNGAIVNLQENESPPQE